MRTAADTVREIAVTHTNDGKEASIKSYARQVAQAVLIEAAEKARVREERKAALPTENGIINVFVGIDKDSILNIDIETFIK